MVEDNKPNSSTELIPAKREKAACIIHYWGEHFEKIGRCAKNSFKKWHPEVDLYHINEKNEHTFSCLSEKKNKSIVNSGKRLLIAKELLDNRGYERVIILGADTITCSYLGAFLEPLASVGYRGTRQGHTDPHIIATFDYDYPLMTKRFRQSILGDEQHLNADAVCFTSVKPINLILKLLEKPEGQMCIAGKNNYGEQAALNAVFYDKDNGIVGAWAEAPPMASFAFYNLKQMASEVPLVLYNVRAKSTLFSDYRDEHGNRYFEYRKVLCDSKHKPWKEFTERFRVRKGSLVAGDGRIIKLWHYCEGFGSGTVEQMEESLSQWKTEFFNEETKKFFREECDCEFFFPEGE